MEEKKGFRDFICSPLGKVALIAVLYVLILGLFVFLVNISESGSVPAIIMCLCFGFFGWKSLNKIQPNIFLIMPIVGWLIFFIVKGVLSVLIGLFVAPFVISKKITEAIQGNV